MTDMPERLAFLLQLLQREDEHLLAVRQRLFGSKAEVTVDWLDKVLDDSIGVDRLESFSAKFSRMQDTMMDKLMPQLLRASGEIPGTAIDNLNRAEQLGLISSSDNWIAMRRLRNLLVHEYVESSGDMAPALNTAYGFSDEMHSSFDRIKSYCVLHWENPPGLS